MTSLAPSAASGSSPSSLAQARRELRFGSLADILADAESLAAGPTRTLGSWTAAQNIDHVRRLIRVSHAGADFTVPWVFRLLGRLIKSRVLRSAFKPGMKTVPAFEPPAEITMDEAIAAFREEIDLASRPGAMSRPSPFLGRMTHDDWERLHCRHAEHHFGFIIPEDAP